MTRWVGPCTDAHPPQEWRWKLNLRCRSRFRRNRAAVAATITNEMEVCQFNYNNIPVSGRIATREFPDMGFRGWVRLRREAAARQALALFPVQEIGRGSRAHNENSASAKNPPQI